LVCAAFLWQVDTTASFRSAQSIESLRSSNLQLEAQIQPRRLRDDQLESIAEALAIFAGKRVDVGSYGLDGESLLLGKQLIKALDAAWIVPIDRTSTQLVVGQIDTGVTVSGPDQKLVKALRGALEKYGGLTEGPKYATGNGGLTVSTGLLGAGTDATVFIGPKPLPK
jgi:hypothetical protein